MAKSKKISKLPAFSRFSKQQLIIITLFVIGFGGFGVWKLAFSSAAIISPSVKVSSDGCEISAINASGYKFEFGAFTSSSTGIGAGGMESAIVPSSRPYTRYIGSMAGMTAYGKIYNNKNRVIASAQIIMPKDCKHPSGYTYSQIISPYGVTLTTPSFKGCKVATSASTFMVYFVGKRPTTDVLSLAAYSTSGKSASSYTWVDNSSTFRVEVPISDKFTLSYQTISAGYGYTAQDGVAPTSLASCY